MYVYIDRYLDIDIDVDVDIDRDGYIDDLPIEHGDFPVRDV